MKKYPALILIICLTVFNPSFAYAKANMSIVETLSNQMEAKILAYKKTRYYTAVEIGFTNPTSDYLEFIPKEIYLDDAVKYSQPLLTEEQMRYVEQHKSSFALFPAVAGVGLGIASLATSRSNSDVSFGLGMAALGMGGTALLTKGFEDQAKNNKLISFKNNTLNNIDKIPPGMTLGGVLYFPATKNPVSVTLITRSKKGSYEKKVFELSRLKKK